MSTPLFGLRWVPDAQLRPLRYLPNPHATDFDDAGGSDQRPRSPGSARRSPASGTDGASHRLQQSVRSLTLRLADAEESVRQKSEQVRWLKEMTKDDARRARVSRWMNGPLLRVFAAWKRVVRNTIRSTLGDLEAQVATTTARQRALERDCDELTRESAVLQQALERFFRIALDDRVRANVRSALRRWGSLRQRMRRRKSHAAAAFEKLRLEAARGRILRHLGSRGIDRARRGLMRAALRALHDFATRAVVSTERLTMLRRRTVPRAAFISLRSYARQRRLCARAVALASRAPSRTVRRAWGTWLTAALKRATSQRRAEASQLAETLQELGLKASQLTTKQMEVEQMRLARSLWGEDEMPEMLQALAADAAAVERAAVSKSPSAANQQRVASEQSAGWLGSQLRLTVATLDSLKRELARERAAHSSTREEVRRNEAVTEQAFTQLQQALRLPLWRALATRCPCATPPFSLFPTPSLPPTRCHPLPAHAFAPPPPPCHPPHYMTASAPPPGRLSSPGCRL